MCYFKKIDMYHHINFQKDTTNPLRAEVLKGLELER